MISQAYLRLVLSYDETTGVFMWKENKRPLFGKSVRVAGRQEESGYVYINIDREKYAAHRLAWLYVHGHFPRKVDHKDGVKSHNWILNLRAASDSQNSTNSKVNNRNRSGLKGAVWDAQRKKWVAKIYPGGRQIYLGIFNTPEEAHTAYCEKGKELYGEFFNTGAS